MEEQREIPLAVSAFLNSLGAGGTIDEDPAGFTPSVLAQARTNPLVQAKSQEVTQEREENLISREVLNAIGDQYDPESFKNLTSSQQLTVFNRITEMYPEKNARKVDLDGIEGVMIGSRFFELKGTGVDLGEEATQAMRDIASIVDAKGTDKRENWFDLNQEAKAPIIERINKFISATGTTDLYFKDESYAPFYERAKAFTGQDSESTRVTEKFILNENEITVSPAVPSAQPAGAVEPRDQPAGQPNNSSVRTQRGSLWQQLTGTVPTRDTPVTLPDTPVSDATTPVSAATTGLNSLLENSPFGSPVPDDTATVPDVITPDTPASPTTATDNVKFALQKDEVRDIVGNTATAITAAEIARRGAAKALETQKVKRFISGARDAMRISGNKIKDIFKKYGGKTTLRRAGWVAAVTVAADDILGMGATFIANQARKAKGEELRDYNTGLIEITMENLGELSVDPRGEQVIRGRILDEIETIQRSRVGEIEADAEKNAQIQYLFGLMDRINTIGFQYGEGRKYSR